MKAEVKPRLRGRIGVEILAMVACACAAGLAWAGEDAETAYDRVKADPGRQIQMCGSITIRFPGDGTRPLPKFELYTFSRRDAIRNISTENFMLLRESRQESILQIEAELREAMELYKQDGTQQLDFSFQMAILIDLNAVEALDTLLEWERHLRAMRAIQENMEDNPADQSPRFHTVGDPKSMTRTYKGRSAENAHFIVISTMTAILREARYAPLLESPWEKQFGEHLSTNFEKGKKAGTNLGPTPGYSVIDWRHDLVRTYGSTVKLTLDDDAIDTVTGWAKNYLATTPPEKRRGAAGMHQWPIGM